MKNVYKSIETMSKGIKRFCKENKKYKIVLEPINVWNKGRVGDIIENGKRKPWIKDIHYAGFYAIVSNNRKRVIKGKKFVVKSHIEIFTHPLMKAIKEINWYDSVKSISGVGAPIYHSQVIVSKHIKENRRNK